MDARRGLSWRLNRPSPEELLLGPEAKATLIFFFGLAGIAVVFALSLALFFGSVRIFLQSISTTLLLYILVNRYGGLELEIFEAGTCLNIEFPVVSLFYFVRFTAPVASGNSIGGVDYMLSLLSASEQDYASLCRCRGFDFFMEIRISWSEASCLPADLFSIFTI